MSSENTSRGRNWAFVLYKDSLDEGEPFKTLDELKTPYFLIWHDADEEVDEETNEVKPKKEHAHLVLMFKGNKSYSKMKELTEKLGCPRPIRIENITSMVRYLCHLDNPEKHQYEADEVISGYGADYLSMASYKNDKYDIIREIIVFVNENDIRYYSDLFDYASRENERWFRALCDCCREDCYRYIYSRATKERDAVKDKARDDYINSIRELTE